MEEEELSFSLGHQSWFKGKVLKKEGSDKKEIPLPDDPYDFIDVNI